MMGGDLVAEGVIGAVFGAVIVGVVSLTVAAINDKHSKNELYAKTVSSFRMEWIKDVRKYLVNLIVLCKKISHGPEDRDNFERCRANILMRLSHTQNKKNKRRNYSDDVRDLLNDMTFEYICENGNNTAKKIEDVGTNLLKEEWERVKVEAGETVKKREEIVLRTEEIKQYKKIGSFD